MRAIDADAFKEYITDACEDMKHLFNDGGAVAKLITESFCKDIDEQPTIHPEPHWIPVTEDIPDEERECWITPKTTSKVYRGVFTRHYGECHRTGFICDDGFMWLNTALAWMYCEVPEPYKGVTE